MQSTGVMQEAHMLLVQRLLVQSVATVQALVHTPVATVHIPG